MLVIYIFIMDNYVYCSVAIPIHSDFVAVDLPYSEGITALSQWVMAMSLEMDS